MSRSSLRASGVALLAVGVILGGLLIGWEPIGGDPDRMYRPIKSELARSLHDNRLPFWSDRLGLGVPLVAESHVAALYPPNWILYRVLSVSKAYRLAMWLHYVALAGAMYAYARRLGLLPWGSALAALTFTLCGFQAIHSSHEPIYSALPFLPLALLFTEAYVDRGSLSWLALLALTWGVQLTLGHFQIQTWTAALVLATGALRLRGSGSYRRALGLIAGLAIGAGIAAIQLVLSWDQARLVGSTNRSLTELMFYSYPPAHWAELAIPRLFQGLPGGPEHPYWFAQGTTGYEACLYVGTIPLLLAFVGLATRHDRSLAPWRIIVPISFALATMPRWWAAGYEAVLHVPGLWYFRAPGRYTLITGLGLALLAGRGFDLGLSTQRFSRGVALAGVFGAAALAWALYWSQMPEYQAALGTARVGRFLGLAAIAWGSGFIALVAWRLRLVGPAVPFLLAATELGILYYQGTTAWGWSVDLPDQSPVLRTLAAETNVGTVAGNLHDLPVRVGRAPTYPYLGMRLPLPNSALEFATSRVVADDSSAVRLLRHMRATHGVWDGPVSAPGVEILYKGDDKALDRLVYKRPGAPEHAIWSLVRYPDPLPAAHATLHVSKVPDLRTLLARLSQTDSADTAWFVAGDDPPDAGGPRATEARIERWDDFGGEVDHNGVCEVVIHRTYAPGWTAKIDDGPQTPVLPVDGGLQAVRLSGSGRSRISLRYQPPHLAVASTISAISLAITLLVLGFAGIERRKQASERPGSE